MIGCGTHQAFVRARGGVTVLGELGPLPSVRWERRRDEISSASVVVSTAGDCCQWLGEVRTVKHELHLFRDGVAVWEGVITRIEFSSDQVEIFAEDILWVAKNTALEVGYSHAHPNIAAAGYRMDKLLRDNTFAKWGDPWNMLGPDRIHRIIGSDEPKTSKVVKAYSCTTFEDFDAFAQYSGMDYTVRNRDVYFWDTHHRAFTLPPLLESYLETEPTVVEYGNEFSTRVFVTNNNGSHSKAQAKAAVLAEWGYIDTVNSQWNEANGAETPAAEDLASWAEQASTLLKQTPTPPVQVRVRENSGLTPDCPYDVADLIPGAWVQVQVTSLCRNVEQWHKVQSVTVEEKEGAETVAISTIDAPTGDAVDSL